jgi:predicted nucleic acid-binding protein
MISTTFDTGALIALEKGDVRVLSILKVARDTGGTITVPATALAQAMRNPARQARLARLIRQPSTFVPELNSEVALEVGRLLARSRTSDIADAHIAWCARMTDGALVTSNPHDMSRIDPDLPLVVLQIPHTEDPSYGP